MKNGLIYGLFDPRDETLRYIGKTCGPLRKRFLEHIRKSRSGKTHRDCWIRELESLSLIPDCIILESVTLSDLNDAEVWNISYFKSIGCQLTNHTAGGDGTLGFKITPETKAKMSVVRRGRSPTEAHRLKLSLAKGSKPFADQHGNTYLNIRAAAVSIGSDKTAIRKVLRGEFKQAKGFVFTYL